MMTSNRSVFGITIGNSSSSIAWINETGCPGVITNTDGEVTTPSFVYFESKDCIVVGEEARQMLYIEPERVVAFNAREVANADYVFSTPDGATYSMVQIAAFIIKKMVQDVEELVGVRVENVALACPSWYGSAERRALVESARYVGLNTVKMVNTSSAAFYAYAKCAHGNTLELSDRILLFDLGGSSLDVCVARMYPSNEDVEILASGGDANLGGADWDLALVELIVGKCCEMTGVSRDTLEDISHRYELIATAEKVKKTLSARLVTKARLAFDGEPIVRVEVTRDEFEAASATLLERAVRIVKQTLEVAARKECVETFKIDAIVCAGGGCLMPQISTRLEREFGQPTRIFEPHLCVAKGAAALGNQPEIIYDPPFADNENGGVDVSAPPQSTLEIE